jgi:putative copper export protein
MTGEAYALLLLVLAKWITDVGIVWLVGACALRAITAVIARRGDRGDAGSAPDLDRGLVRHAGLALGLLLVATAARLYAQTYASFGLDEAVTGELLRLVAEETRWGGRWMWQGAAVVVAAPMVVLVMGQVRLGWWLLGAATLIVVGTAPLTGHAIAYSGGAVVPMALQVGHLLAAGVWLGSLLALVAVALPRLGSGEGDHGLVVARLVDRFSPVALTAAALLAGTGVWTAVLYVDEIPQLWETLYGRALLLKVGLFGVTAALGAYNWRRVRPALTSTGGVARLRRSSRLELLVALTVLAVTAWLVHLPMPHE